MILNFDFKKAKNIAYQIIFVFTNITAVVLHKLSNPKTQ